jgi:hypothetical protein
VKGFEDRIARELSEIDTQREALAAHASQKNWLDHQSVLD